uniref:RING-type E3 ubiquitin transferase n=1 Tax=Steinernema glaseri TaxID=37863 RepID=A0A1I7ZLB8_9BILA
MVKRGGGRRGPHVTHDLSDYDKEYLSGKNFRPDFDVEAKALNIENLQKELSCPICKNILQRTKITKDCMHRFCANCIVPLLRDGQKECPVCKKDFAKNGPLRDDLNYDGIIEAIRHSQPSPVKKRKFSDVFNEELHPLPKPQPASEEFPALRAELNGDGPPKTPPRPQEVDDSSDGFKAPVIPGNTPLMVTPPQAKPTCVKEFYVDINQVSRDPNTSKLSKLGDATLQMILSHLRNVKLAKDHSYDFEVVEPADPNVKKVTVRALIRPPAQQVPEPEPKVEPARYPPKKARYYDEIFGYHKRLMTPTLNTELVLWPDRGHFNDRAIPRALRKSRYIITSGDAKIGQMIEYLFIRAKVESDNFDFRDTLKIDFGTVLDERPATAFRFVDGERGPVVKCEQLCGPEKARCMMVCTAEPFRAVDPEFAISEVLTSSSNHFNLKRPYRLVFRVTRRT